jgi:hypothetical protein
MDAGSILAGRILGICADFELGITQSPSGFGWDIMGNIGRSRD